MAKVFEDYFSELQADMVAISLEYVEKRAEKIYIYCSFEERSLFFDVFYEINGKIVHKHKINEAITSKRDQLYDVSDERQLGLLDIGIDNLKKLSDLCEKYDRDMPTEIKLYYNVEKNSLKAEYSYELKHSNSKEKIADDLFEEWYQQQEQNNSNVR